MLRKQELINMSYDKLAEDYNNIADLRRNYCNTIDMLIQDNFWGENILDIGSGNGERIANIQKELNVQVYSIEASDNMYRLLKNKKKICSRKTNAQEYQEDLVGKFDNVTALWNVFGHIPTEKDLNVCLNNVYKYLKKGGRLIFDINNRHNVNEYGYRVIGRIMIDMVNFKRDRGDVYTTRKTKEGNVKLFGHLFTRNEIVKELKKSKFTDIEIKYINYKNGALCRFKYSGQMFIVARKN